jgi:ribosomal protein S18 acetylase RimI-like enzyme
MLTRSARLEDLDACLTLDPSYVTDRVWQMNVHEGNGAMTTSFNTVRLPRPIHVAYPRDPVTLRANWHHQDCFQVALDGPAPEGQEPSKIIGYVTMSTKDWHQTGWIADLVVAPERRRQGVGTALLRAASRWAREEGLNRLMIEVQTKNYPGICFVQRRGFGFCGYNDHYYTNRDIALFFVLNLRSLRI